MKQNAHVVLIEDALGDMRAAARILDELGVKPPTVFRDVKKAMVYLEKVADGELPCPDLIVLDLDFGADSGFEVLRFHKTNPRLHPCKIVVWTALGETEQELCRLFGVDAFVSKRHGEPGLSAAISKSFAKSAGA